MDGKLAPKGAGLGYAIPSKTAAIEDAQNRVTVRLGIYTLIANIYM